MRGLGGGSGAGRLRIAAACLLMGTAGCRLVGVQPAEEPSPREVIRTIPETERAVSETSAAPERVSPSLAPAPVEVEGIDPILHSRVGQDLRFREQIEFWTGFWTTRGSDHFVRYLERMGTYQSLVDGELERRGLPNSLRYLPIVESGYHPGAVSRVGATGLWQIMTPTARELGLSVGVLVDDRRDPVAATVAALDYLETLHRRFDSWFLALAAYNAGPGRVSNLLNRYASDAGIPGDERFLQIRSYLPAETREFVPKLFAAAELAGDPSEYGFPAFEAHLPFAFDEVLVPDATSLDVVARAAEVEHEEVLSLNPHFLRGFTPVGERRVVRVPAGAGSRFEVNYPLIPPGERVSFLEHVVARGETLSHISNRYGVSLAELSAANGDLDPRRLQIGARLVVPVAGGRMRTVVASSGSAAGVTGTAAFLGAVGGEEADRAGVISNGQTPAPTAYSRVHRVVSGDTWGAIARRYGVSIDALAVANGRTSRDIIRAGEQLRIP